MASDAQPLIVVHVVFRFGIGGMENGLVNLINRLPQDAYYHHVVALTECERTFAARVRSTNASFHGLGKRPGHDPRVWWRLLVLLRRIRPHVVHSRNLGALEAHVPAWIAGVPVRIHGEHGWDVHDLEGRNERYRWMRRILSVFVHRFVTVSEDLQRYLTGAVGIDSRRISQIYNGVDSERFHPLRKRPERPFTIGTVGRLKEVKNQGLLIEAFIRVLDRRPDLRGKVRLTIVGDGPLRSTLREQLAAAGCGDDAVLDGASDDIPAAMRGLDLFVLPSLAEGISNTILEAMATGLPVVATRVGGNVELVRDGETGTLVPSADADALTDALLRYIDQRELAVQHGAAGRRRVERRFSLEAMVAAYDELYRRLAGEHCPEYRTASSRAVTPR